MRWPFKSRKTTDLRVFRDPKTNEIILRMVGPYTWPSPEAFMNFTVTVTLDTTLDGEGAQRLYEQLSHFVIQRLT